MRKSRFIEHSIMGALSFLRQALSADEYASLAGFLQAREPRLKLVSICMLLLAVLVTRSIVFLIALYFIGLLLAIISSVRLKYFLKRTWLFVPLFALCIGLPAVFNFFSPGQPLLVVKLFKLDLIVTRQGVAAAAIFFMRVLTSVSLSALLVLTTRHTVLLRVLRIVFIPQIFVMTLEMCYRYLYLFIDIIANTYTAIRSRVEYVSSSAKAQRVVAWNIASLWHRSYQPQEQVYNAMLSRGYTGEPKVLEEPRQSFTDWSMAAGSALIFFLSIWTNHFLN